MEKEFKELNSVIQVCPYCGKLDVYKDDGHKCDREWQTQRSNDFMDNVGDR